MSPMGDAPEPRHLRYLEVAGDIAGYPAAGASHATIFLDGSLSVYEEMRRFVRSVFENGEWEIVQLCMSEINQ